jgi:hypothetical protein
MTDLNQLTYLQRLILAALEEAGEENFASLTNTVQQQKCGSFQEIAAVTTALVGLSESDLVRIATARDPISLRLIAMNKEESLAALSTSKSALVWSQAEGIWLWGANMPQTEVVITNAGMASAHQILSRHGWPPELS